LPDRATISLFSLGGNQLSAPGVSPARRFPHHAATTGARSDLFGAEPLSLSQGIILPEYPARMAQIGGSPAFSRALSGIPSGHAGVPAALTQLSPPRGNQATRSPSSPSYVPGAAMVYRKEQAAHKEEPPATPQISQDIEFIKKTVKQSGTTTRTVQTNTAVNLPGSDTQRSADLPRDLDRQVNAIADKVYNALERRLRSEQMRKGLL
jgi:hypothetical protein